ncbi:hypothetical protein BHM03_00031921 [Ensete ventricosum]|nr:hypothetical protein BHM03_00031921 [Ensete ventricosum]
MSSSSGQPLFRYTQTPSKVLHLRNLPWECMEEELIELGKPFGKIVNTKCNVGANRNQAFVEFVSVFSAFGFVHKIATFEKAAGFQVLSFFSTFSSCEVGSPAKLFLFTPFLYFLSWKHFILYVTTAAVAKEALEGHCIYDGGYCKLHLSYSRHTDLNVKAYSDKSRDYTISSSGMLSNPQASSVPSASTGWQTNPQAAGTSVGSIGMQAPVPAGQTAAWDPSKTTFATSAGTFPGQPFVPSAGAPFPTSGGPPSAPAGYFQASQQRPQYGVQPRPSSGAPPFGHPPGYF